MNAIANAMNELFARDLEHFAGALLQAARKWANARRRATGCEIQALQCVRAWAHVLRESQTVSWVVDDWRKIGIHPEEVADDLPQGTALAVYLAVEIDALRCRGARAEEYDEVCRRLRGLAARVEG